MKLSKKTICKVENAVHVWNILNIPTTSSIVLNCLVSDYIKCRDNFQNANKTLIINDTTHERNYLMDGLRILGISSARKLYALYNEFNPENTHILSYDINTEEYARIEYRKKLSLAYGSSRICEREIDKLFVSFFGSDERGFEGMLVLNIRNNQTKIVDLNGHPSNMTVVDNRLFVIVGGFDGRNKLLILDIEANIILDEVEISSYTIDVIHRDRKLMLLELFKGIHIFDIHQRKIIEFINIPEIHSIQPTYDNRFFVLFLERRKPYYQIDRLALYDIKKGKIIDNISITCGQFLKTLDDGRIICVELDKSGNAIINEVNIIK